VDIIAFVVFYFVVVVYDVVLVLFGIFLYNFCGNEFYIKLFFCVVRVHFFRLVSSLLILLFL
jgi:hypothetical protein